jgi:hypothetical protein
MDTVIYANRVYAVRYVPRQTRAIPARQIDETYASAYRPGCRPVPDAIVISVRKHHHHYPHPRHP